MKLPVLERAPGHLIRRAQQLHIAAWHRTISKQITSAQYGALLVIAQTPGLDQRAIGERISFDKSSVANMLRILEERGYITRAEDPIDTRRRRVEITDAGFVVLNELAPNVQSIQDLLLAPLTKSSRPNFVRLLQEITECVELARREEQMIPPRAAGTPDFHLLQAPGHLLRRAQQVHTALWKKYVSLSFTSIQYSLLLALYSEERTDQTTLGEQVGIDKSTTAEVMNRMARRGIVTRHKDEIDRRRYVIKATSVSRSLVERHSADVIRVQHELLRNLKARDRETMMEFLERVTAF